MKLTIVEKKTFLAGLQCTLTSSCAINLTLDAYDKSMNFMDLSLKLLGAQKNVGFYILQGLSYFRTGRNFCSF